MNLTQNMNPSNLNHISKIAFLDTEVHTKNKLHTKNIQKKIDYQKSLNINSERPKILKTSILHSQALTI